jgi:hypothetical protein
MEKKIERKITSEEVSTLKPPGYSVAAGRGLTEAERDYWRQRTELLHREAKKHPGYSIRMHCKNGIPVSFTYFKRSLMEQALMKRVNRTLEGVRGGLKTGVSRDVLTKRIDRVLEKAKALKWEE